MILNLLIFSVISYLFTSLAFRRLKDLAIDIPNSRSSHVSATPTSGGIVFVVIDIISSVLNGSLFKLFFIPLSSIGFLDDIYDISSKYRFFIQFITSTCIVFSSPLVHSLYNQFFNLFLILFLFVAVIFSISLINFINFTDGIDGLVSGCMIVALFSAQFLTPLYLIPLIGSLIGFFVLNWHPAKLFMGDVGSTYLGAMFSYCLFNTTNLADFFSLTLFCAPLLLDALLTLIRRFLASQSIFSPHRLHLYQRLVQAGLSHSLVSSIYVFSCIMLSLAYFLFGLPYLLVTLACICLLGVFLEFKIAYPFHN